MGENPITDTIRLAERDLDWYLELNPNGTAVYAHSDDDEPECQFKYTYDADAKKIYMQVEKASYYDGLLNYDDNLALIDEGNSVAALREWLKEVYEKDKDSEWFKQRHPDCNSYEDYEKNWYEEDGFDSLAAYLEYQKQIDKAYIKAIFGALVTFSYNTENGKMTLIEKFTGIKNIFFSWDEDESSEIYIEHGVAWIDFEDDEYMGIINNGKIAFRNRDDGKGTTVNATYTEDISAGTVTVTFNGEDYVYKITNAKFTQK